MNLGVSGKGERAMGSGGGQRLPVLVLDLAQALTAKADLLRDVVLPGRVKMGRLVAGLVEGLAELHLGRSDERFGLGLGVFKRLVGGENVGHWVAHSPIMPLRATWYVATTLTSYTQSRCRHSLW